MDGEPGSAGEQSSPSRAAGLDSDSEAINAPSCHANGQARRGFRRENTEADEPAFDRLRGERGPRFQATSGTDPFAS